MKVVIDRDNVENGVTHSADIFMELVLPWVNNHKIVCADSYFTSVTAAELLYLSGLKFIVVVETATKKYPRANLDYQELEKSWYRYGLVKRKTIPYGCDLLVYVWMDQDRRYFIASGSSMEAGDNMERIHSRHLEDVSTNADPMDVTITTPQPKAS